MMKETCLGCTKRTIRCHGSCPEYQEALRENEEEKARKFLASSADNFQIGRKYHASTKWQKAHYNTRF